MSKSRRRGLLIVAATLIIILCAVLLLRSCSGEEQEDNPSVNINDDGTPLAPGIQATPGFDLTPDTALSDSAPEQPDPDEILAELNRQVEASMITMSMNPEPTFKTGRDSGNLLIHNDESNVHTQVVQIIRDDTEEIVYTSGMIPVGKYINEDKLDVLLSAGNYRCKAYFHSVDDSTGEILGTGAVEITLHIQG